MSGPLTGFKVVEMAGIGPAPMCAMMLADLGADVVRLDRVAQVDIGITRERQYNLLNRGRPSVAVDLKNPDGVETALRLIDQADAVIEGFRPGVMEKLGLGPDVCLERNPRLVYGRMTGWGQEGPLAQAAGHDINYIALTGALHSIGRPGEKPVVPLNLVGDFGGGALYLAFGVCAAMLETSRSGRGQVVDAAMIDGAASLMTATYGMHASGLVSNDRGTNILDGGAHFYDAYETSDGQWVSIGSIEGRFHDELCDVIGIPRSEIPDRNDESRWPELKERIAGLFAQRTRDEWCELMEGTDICFAPVLDMDEAADHPHNAAREVFVEVDGVVQPAPAPRFDRTPGRVHMPPPDPGQHTDEALGAWGFAADEIAKLRDVGAVG